MLESTKYEIKEKLYEGTISVVYRGVRKHDNKSVILKTHKSSLPLRRELYRLRNEYEILKDFDIQGVIKTYGLESLDKNDVLILEDFKGVTLKSYLQSNQLELREFLSLAIELSNILGEIHGRGIIHKDLNPGNILINPETRKVKIIDFSIATILPREKQWDTSIQSLQGTLAYISPEQSGRMNRSIDYRSDYYSLGVTFYEMLTGGLPFQVEDPLELVYCHVAKNPASLCKVNGKIPKVVSRIVMKLLSKNGENRYQSASGLRRDLEDCSRNLRESGFIHEFEIGCHDVSKKFIIPEKLYGRESEIANLTNVLGRVRNGSSELVLVVGYTGIGKSSLVHEVQKSFLQKRGFFIFGKFDQNKINIPYSAITQVFKTLIRQLLTENEETLAQWKEKLVSSLGSNGQIIINIIPELEYIIGRQSSLLYVEPNEVQNRFKLVFQAFVGVFMKSEHPLVIFLDDLQWIDMASLNILKILLANQESRYLCIIGAYRDNEIGKTHPLNLSVEEIQREGIKVSKIALSPLNIRHMTQLISDTFSCNEDKSSPLSELVIEKTGGNPFFVNQLLKSLYEEGILFFDDRTGSWQWDLESIRMKGVTDNIVELVVGKIKKFPEKAQHILRLASCIGNLFDLETLVTVSQKEKDEVMAILLYFMMEGLILPVNNISFQVQEFGEPGYDLEHGKQSTENIDHEIEIMGRPAIPHKTSILKTKYPNFNHKFKFLHDRVQQASYSLIPENQKKEVHLIIGKLLLENRSQKGKGGVSFDLINHLNIGSELIMEESKRVELAKFNLTAGEKARASNAYHNAMKFVTCGLELLPENRWVSQYELTHSLSVVGAEAAFLCSDYSRMEILIDEVLKNAKNILDKIEVYKIKVQFFITQNKPSEATNVTLDTLSLLGVYSPKKPNKINIFLESFKTRWAIIGKNREHIKNLPPLKDPHLLAVMDMITTSISAFHQDPSKVFVILIYKMVALSAKYGNSQFSPLLYALYSSILYNIEGRLDSGYQFGCLSQELIKTFKTSPVTVRAYSFFYLTIKHWKAHLKETLEPFLVAYKTTIELGSLRGASISSNSYCYYLLFSGCELRIVEQETARFLGYADKHKEAVQRNVITMCRQFALNLMGYSSITCRLMGSAFNEDEMLPILKRDGMNMEITILYTHKAVLNYLFGDFSHSLENMVMALEVSELVFGDYNITRQNLYHSLVLLALYPKVERSEQRRYMKIVRLNQRKMKRWAFHAPMNHLHKYYLVEAELAHVKGKDIKAMNLYDKAISLAKRDGYIQKEALANEVAARFYLSRGREKSAIGYMNEACYCYYRWGAHAKVKDLEERYPQLLRKEYTQSRLSKDLSTTFTVSSEMTSSTLDLKALTKSSLAISSEVILDKLLSKFMNIVIENAGAKKGCLLIEQSGQLVIETKSKLGWKNTGLQRSDSLKSDIHGSILPVSIIQYSKRTHESVVLDESVHNEMFTTDPYMINARPESLLCMPIMKQGRVMGILYLENNVTKGVFTVQKMEFLKILSSQMAISIENARLYEKFVSYQKQLKSLASSLSLAEERERRRIAENLHDSVGQNLVVIQMRLAALQELISSNGVTSLLNETKGLVGQTIQDVRSMTFELSPPVLYALGLEPAIEWLIEQFQKQHNIVIDFVRDDEEKPLDDDMRALLFKSTRELLFNSIKHAKAHLITITIRRVDSFLKIDIIDDGVGFNSQNVSLSMTNTGGFGLFNIRERLEHLGGHMWIKSKPGHGTQVTVDAPLKYEYKETMAVGKSVFKETESGSS